MATFEVDTDLIISCRVKIKVTADSKEEAIDAAADILPANYALERAKEWKAVVTLKPPKGIDIRVVKTYHFEQASGSDKARKVNS